MLKAKVSMFETMQSKANRDLREKLQHQRVWLYDLPGRNRRALFSSDRRRCLLGLLGLLKF